MFGIVAGGDEIDLGVVVGAAGEAIDEPAEGERGAFVEGVTARGPSPR